MKTIDVSPTMKNIIIDKYKRKKNIKVFNKNKVQIDEIKSKLPNYNFLETFINFEKVSTVYEVNPVDILSPINYDIFIKYIFFKNQKNRFYKRMYINHIKVFNNFKEPDGSKNSKKDFLKLCKNFIDENDYTNKIIPLSKQKILIDGSHRVAASIIKKKNILCSEFNVEDLYFDFNFFLERGLNKKYCDYIGFIIIELVKNITFLKFDVLNNKQCKDELKKLNNKYDVYYYKQRKSKMFVLLSTNDNEIKNNEQNFIFDKERIRGEYSKFINKSIIRKYKRFNKC